MFYLILIHRADEGGFWSDVSKVARSPHVIRYPIVGVNPLIEHEYRLKVP